MSSFNRTAEQAKAAHVAKMGEEIGLVYSALWHEVAWIHKKWAEYVALFGSSQERVQLLSKAAPSLTRTIQDALWEDVLLHLARLTDSPKSMGKRNLSVRRLVQAVESSAVGSKVSELEKTALNATEFARDWRNRKLAHRDLELVLDGESMPLAPASRLAVKTALESLVELLNAVSLHYLESTTMFDMVSDGHDATSLLYIIRDGLRYDEERLAKVKSGELGYQHLHPEPLEP